MITFYVPGQPAPKGSPRIVTRARGGAPLPFPRVLSDSPRTDAWAACVAAFARQAMQGRRPWVDTVLRVAILFGLERPASHYGAGRNASRVRPGAPVAPAVKPDIDKLTRTTLDAMQGPVFDEDSRIVRLVVTKTYAGLGCEAGAVIVVGEATEAGIAEASQEFDRWATDYRNAGQTRRNGSAS